MYICASWVPCCSWVPGLKSWRWCVPSIVMHLISFSNSMICIGLGLWRMSFVVYRRLLSFFFHLSKELQKNHLPPLPSAKHKLFSTLDSNPVHQALKEWDGNNSFPVLQRTGHQLSSSSVVYNAWQRGWAKPFKAHDERAGPVTNPSGVCVFKGICFVQTLFTIVGFTHPLHFGLAAGWKTELLSVSPYLVQEGAKNLTFFTDCSFFLTLFLSVCFLRRKDFMDYIINQAH